MTKKALPTTQAPRKKKVPRYRAFRLTGKINALHVKPLPTVRQLWRDTWQFMRNNKKTMLIIWAMYVVTYMLFVKNIEGFDGDTALLKDELHAVLQGDFGGIFTVISLYASFFTSLTATSDDIANFMQTAIFVVFSLVYIWVLRKLHIKKSVSIKEAFYSAPRPLIPFLGVLFIFVLELLPAGVGSLILVTAQSTTAVQPGLEMFAIYILTTLSVVVSLYLLTGSLFAMYIATLPNTGPWQAVRSSLQLLNIHRWIVARKILGFFILLVIVGFFLVLPFIIWLPAYSEIAFFLLACGSFGVAHTFMYKLYRSML